MHIPTKQRHCLSGRRKAVLPESRPAPQGLPWALLFCGGSARDLLDSEIGDLELTCLQLRALFPIKWGGSFYFTGCGGSGWDGPSVGPSSLPVLGVKLSLGFIPGDILGEFSWFIFLLFPCFLSGPRLHLFPRMTFSPCLRPSQSGLFSPLLFPPVRTPREDCLSFLTFRSCAVQFCRFPLMPFITGQ